MLERMTEKGPFTLGRWSWAINFASLLVSAQIFWSRVTTLKAPTQFTIFICVLFVLPTARPVTPENMNYAIVAVGGIMVMVLANWLLWGRYRFTGPVATVDAHEENAHSPEKT
jgi:hypothetical protein